MRHVFIAVLLVFLVSPIPAVPAHASDLCQFVLGFKAIHDMLPSEVGECQENEWHNPTNGDALQRTTRGLLVWRKADNWTAFTNGHQTWINGPFGLQARLNDQRFLWELDALDYQLVPLGQKESEICDSLPGSATGPIAAACFVIYANTLMLQTAGTNAFLPPVSPRDTAPLPAPAADSIEWVGVRKVDSVGNHAIVVRRSGEVWWLEYGVGCLGLGRFEGRQVPIHSPGLFAGVGSSIIMPDDGDSCRIWQSERIN